MPDPTYCYQRSLLLHAPTRGFQAGFRQVLEVYESLAYFGPGTDEETAPNVTE